MDGLIFAAGLAAAVALVIAYHWIDRLHGPRAIVFRIKARNLLYRLRLVPMYTALERAHASGHASGRDYQTHRLEAAEKAVATHEDLLERVQAQFAEFNSFFEMVADAKPHHLPTLKKKARRMLGKGKQPGRIAE